MARVARRVILLITAAALPSLSSGVNQLLLAASGGMVRKVANQSDVENEVFNAVRDVTASFAHLHDEFFGRFLSSCSFSDDSNSSATAVTATASSTNEGNDGGGGGGGDGDNHHDADSQNTLHGRDQDQGNRRDESTSADGNGHAVRSAARPDRIFVAQGGTGGGGLGNLLLKLKCVAVEAMVMQSGLSVGCPRSAHRLRRLCTLANRQQLRATLLFGFRLLSGALAPCLPAACPRPARAGCGRCTDVSLAARPARWSASPSPTAWSTSFRPLCLKATPKRSCTKTSSTTRRTTRRCAWPLWSSWSARIGSRKCR
jgi:hypothetical protein